MSASSNWVTCGTLTQLACSRGPGDLLDAAQRLALDRAERREVDRRHPRQTPRRRTAAGSVRRRLTCALTSCSVMRPLVPVPLTRPRSTPSSRAKRRIDGLACAVENPGASTAPAAVSRTSGRGAGAGVGRERFAARAGGVGWYAGGCAGAIGPLTPACGRPLAAGAARGGGGRTLDERDQVALRHAAAALHLQLADHARDRRRHVHRGLFGLERDQRSRRPRPCRPAAPRPR